MVKNRVALAAVLSLALAGAACGGGTPDASPEPTETSPSPLPGPTETAGGGTTYTAVEYEFEGPDELAAGSQTITLENEGEEQHELQLLQLEEGMTIDDVEALFEEGEAPSAPPEWVTPLGGTFAEPGGSQSFDTDLQAGTYVMICLVPAPDGTPHAALGMVDEVTVA